MSTTPTNEVHRNCGGRVMFRDSPLVAEWRCAKCGRLCPIGETVLDKSAPQEAPCHE